MTFLAAFATAEELAAVLACIETAILTVDRSLRVHFANPAARQMVRRRDGLMLIGDQLRASRVKDTQLLSEAVASAAARPSAGTNGHAAVPDTERVSAVVVALWRGDEAPAGRVVAVPLKPEPDGGAAIRAEAALFVDIPSDVEAAAEARHLQLAFQLTPAEARLAALLLSGTSLTEAASQFGVSHNTVRSQLRAIFEKTHVRRQADLMRLLQSSRSLRLLTG